MRRSAESRAISRSRRRTRLRSTALPTFFDTVKPQRTGPSSPRLRACSRNAGAMTFVPVAAARKSARCRNRSMETMRDRKPPSGGQPLTSARAPSGHHFASAFGGHARAKTVAALAYKLTRLIGPLHDSCSPVVAPWRFARNPHGCGPACEFARLIREPQRPVNAGRLRQMSRHKPVKRAEAGMKPQKIAGNVAARPAWASTCSRRLGVFPFHSTGLVRSAEQCGDAAHKQIAAHAG